MNAYEGQVAVHGVPSRVQLTVRTRDCPVPMSPISECRPGADILGRDRNPYAGSLTCGWEPPQWKAASECVLSLFPLHSLFSTLPLPTLTVNPNQYPLLGGTAGIHAALRDAQMQDRWSLPSFCFTRQSGLCRNPMDPRVWL